VGANRGGWTRSVAQYYPSAEYLLVEPQLHLEHEIRDLRDRGLRIHWAPVGVSDIAGNLAFSVAPNDTASSFVPDAAIAAAHGLPRTMVEVRTLNQLVTTHLSGVPELVKIDAEGYDLKALAGASDLVGKTEVIFVEAGVCAPLIENDMARVLAWMKDAGYRLFDITDINRRRADGLLWLCELAFIRCESPLFERLRQAPQA